nr:hypothetical protein SHCRBa_004_G10_F_240 [Saccharum hybrid cultivar R570]
MSAWVGDFGLSRILPDNASGTLQSSTSTTGIRGTIGYVAPEYGEGSFVSTQVSLDLQKFAEAALPNRALDLSNPAIWLHQEAKEKDPADAAMRSWSEVCLVSVIWPGVSCSKKQPRE